MSQRPEGHTLEGVLEIWLSSAESSGYNSMETSYQFVSFGKFGLKHEVQGASFFVLHVNFRVETGFYFSTLQPGIQCIQQVIMAIKLIKYNLKAGFQRNLLLQLSNQWSRGGKAVLTSRLFCTEFEDIDWHLTHIFCSPESGYLYTRSRLEDPPPLNMDDSRLLDSQLSPNAPQYREILSI
ncbi:hypothetical protein PM082_015245 [Marasmius tenuissimus]|nr:hypothetical protein PM082_015245 [Marasmius tenuissimus]